MGKDFFLKTVIGICGVVWVASLVLAGTVPASRALFAPFSLVVSVAGGIVWIFDRWSWSWPLVRLLVKRPDLRGTWKGAIASEWVSPQTNARLAAIPTFIVVTQTATSLHVRQLTDESESITLAAAIVDDADDAHSVVGVYRNEPQSRVRDRSPIHLGALRLRVGGADELGGDYWTDRNSRGQLTLKRISKKKAKSLADAQKLAAKAP
jgi:hypothetical protein